MRKFDSYSRGSAPSGTLTLVPRPRRVGIKASRFGLAHQTTVALSASGPRLVKVTQCFGGGITPTANFRVPIRGRNGVRFGLASGATFNTRKCHLRMGRNSVVVATRRPTKVFCKVRALLRVLPPRVGGDRGRGNVS